jgi:predicted transcriptional regulator
MRRLTIYLSEEEYRELRRLAESRGLTVSSLIRLAVARLVEREEGRGDLKRVLEEIGRLRRLVEELGRGLRGASAREQAERGLGGAQAAPGSLPSFLRDNPWLQVLSEKR